MCKYKNAYGSSQPMGKGILLVASHRILLKFRVLLSEISSFVGCDELFPTPDPRFSISLSGSSPWLTTHGNGEARAKVSVCYTSPIEYAGCGSRAQVGVGTSHGAELVTPSHEGTRNFGKPW